MKTPKEIIKSLGISAKQLAEEMGYSTSTIYKVLNGKGSAKATAAFNEYLEEIRYWSGDDDVTETTEVNLKEVPDVFACKADYILAWHEANKHLIEEALPDMVQEDKFFRREAALIASAIYSTYGLSGKFTKGRRKPMLKPKWNEEAETAKSPMDGTRNILETFDDASGNETHTYDDGGITGKIQNKTGKNIDIGRANDSAYCGRHSVWEEGYNKNDERVVDSGGNFLVKTDSSKVARILAKEDAIVQALVNDTRVYDYRQKRKNSAINAFKDFLQEIIDCKDVDYLKNELLGKGKMQAYITKRLVEETGSRWIVDHCYYADFSNYKKETIKGKTTEELIEIAKNNYNWKPLNKVVWRKFHISKEQVVKKHHPKVYEEIYQGGSMNYTNKNKATEQDIYEKVQAILNRIPVDNEKELGKLIRDGVGISFGLSQSDAKKATWYATKCRKEDPNTEIAFPYDVYKSLIHFGKAKYQRTPQGIVKVSEPA